MAKSEFPYWIHQFINSSLMDDGSVFSLRKILTSFSNDDWIAKEDKIVLKYFDAFFEKRPTYNEMRHLYLTYMEAKRAKNQGIVKKRYLKKIQKLCKNDPLYYNMSNVLNRKIENCGFFLQHNINSKFVSGIIFNKYDLDQLNKPTMISLYEPLINGKLKTADVFNWLEANIKNPWYFHPFGKREETLCGMVCFSSPADATIFKLCFL